MQFTREGLPAAEEVGLFDFGCRDRGGLGESAETQRSPPSKVLPSLTFQHPSVSQEVRPPEHPFILGISQSQKTVGQPVGPEGVWLQARSRAKVRRGARIRLLSRDRVMKQEFRAVLFPSQLAVPACTGEGARVPLASLAQGSQLSVWPPHHLQGTRCFNPFIPSGRQVAEVRFSLQTLPS
ncbi:UNVERIFIED_CONTAM: hypothetical protein K2H54_073276 [Gekko kuhli]